MIDLQHYLDKASNYLNNHLFPFWEERIEEPEFGGFQSNYGKDGKATDVTEKTFLCQARCLFTLSFVLRQGFKFIRGTEILDQGFAFIKKYLEDPQFGGFYWVVDRDGTVIDDNKVLYGHSFLLYGLSEWALLTGCETAKAEACKVFDLIREKAVDPAGGYIEHFKRDFSPRPARGDVGCHKSLDVHMHLMEAFTALYELTGDEAHKRALDEVVEIILTHMVDPELGTGISMLTQDWKPIANVELDTVWGADRFEDEKSVDITSYGHNIELAWLFVHMLRISGKSIEPYKPWLTKIYDHTYNHGVDWEFGGVFVEGHKTKGVTETNKEFWQQCEAMVGFLDAFEVTGDEKYLDAFANIQDFVFEKFINWDLGEYLPLLNREGEILWDYMSHNWKICYHTLRASALIVRKLEAIIGEYNGKN